MTWIPILERKPADSQQVLILDEVNEYVIGFYYEAGGFFIGSVDGGRISKSRFWRPLPDFPVKSEHSIVETENPELVISDIVEQV